MTGATTLEAFLAAAAVDPAVHELRPDYVALLVAADGLPSGPSDEPSDAWLREAEAAESARLAGAAPEDRPHVASWRDAYRAFGAKPQRTRNSLEVMCRRWNWRQCTRTQLTAASTRALFIVDALGPDALATATHAGDDLERRLHALDPVVDTASRLIAAPRT